MTHILAKGLISLIGEEFPENKKKKDHQSNRQVSSRFEWSIQRKRNIHGLET